AEAGREGRLVAGAAVLVEAVEAGGEGAITEELGETITRSRVAAPAERPEDQREGVVARDRLAERDEHRQRRAAVTPAALDPDGEERRLADAGLAEEEGPRRVVVGEPGVERSEGGRGHLAVDEEVRRLVVIVDVGELAP